MADLEKVIKDIEEIKDKLIPAIARMFGSGFSSVFVCEKTEEKLNNAIELLKEKQGISVDAFLQWCIESHRMGDASRRGIEYWINEFKAWKQKAKDGDQ